MITIIKQVCIQIHDEEIIYNFFLFSFNLIFVTPKVLNVDTSEIIC